MKIGFTTTTLRNIRNLNNIVNIAAEAKVDCIEWGGDVHIKNIEAAKLAAQLCADKNIEISSYGSYYKVGSGKKDEWKKIAEIAQALNASSVRVWLGTKNSEITNEAYYSAITEDAKYICSVAEKHSFSVCAECHDNTFNNNTDAFLQIKKDIGADNFKTYFQSRYKKLNYDLDRIERTFEHTESVHISFSELRREQFPKFNPSYIDSLLEKLLSVGFDGNLLLEYTYLFDRFGIPSCLINDISKLRAKVGECK